MRFLFGITAAISGSAHAVAAQGAKPELPRVYLETKYPTVSRKVPVRAGSNLQAALNAARSGDELVLAAGASYVGNFRWTRCLPGYVTVTGPGVGGGCPRGGGGGGGGRGARPPRRRGGGADTRVSSRRRSSR